MKRTYIKLLVPLFVYPFLAIIFYAVKDIAAKPINPIAHAEGLQTELPVAELKGKGLTGKLEAMRAGLGSKLRSSTGTALQTISWENDQDDQYELDYTDQELAAIDAAAHLTADNKAVAAATKRAKDSIREEEKSLLAGLFDGQPTGIAPIDLEDEEKAAQIAALQKLAEQENRRLEQTLAMGSSPTFSEDEIAALSQNTTTAAGQPKPLTAEQEKAERMQEWKEQMLFLDSLNSTPEERAERAYLAKIQKQQDQAIKSGANASEIYRVRKSDQISASSNAFFNTIIANRDREMIKAVIDQDLTVVAGSRVKLKLIDDITLNDRLLLKRNSYIYGIVSALGNQRVSIKISTVRIQDQILEVNVAIYDQDGLPGVYVPASQFRSAGKEFAGQAATQSGSQLQIGTADPKSSFFYNIADQAVQGASRATSKLARTNRAHLKKETTVFLIDPQTIR